MAKVSKYENESEWFLFVLVATLVFFFLVSDVDIEHLLVVPAFDEDGKEPIALFCLINKIGSKTGYVFIVIEFSSFTTVWRLFDE